VFTKSHTWYDEIYGFKDYAAAARLILTNIEALNPRAKTLLDVACGTGRHLEYIQEKYTCEGLDINEDMLVKARARCPEVPFHLGNMVNFDLGRTFDVITLLFSSIAYVKHRDNLIRTICNLERHLGSGGVMLIEPLFTPENYWTGRIVANHVDLPKLKICWMYATAPAKNNVISQNISWMIGTPSGVETFEEVHEWGLFSADDWQAAFDAASLDHDYDPVGPFNRGMYILTRKAL
jgi:ubiquinone/menaquinone biosynthesis C-methylase UbiE